jgi:WD40 repeat protein
LHLYEVATGVEVPLKLPPTADRVLDIDADKLQLLAADGEGDALLWNVRSGTEVLRLEHPGGIVSAEFSLDGRLILLSGNDNTARVWDRNTGRLIHTLTHAGKLVFAGFGGASRNVFAVTDERIAHVWALEPKRHIVLPHKERVLIVQVTPDGRRALIVDGGAVRFWETASGKQVGWLGSWEGVDYAELSSDGQLNTT